AAASASHTPSGGRTSNTPAPFRRWRRWPSGVVTSSAIVPDTPAACRRAIIAFGRVRLFTGYQSSAIVRGYSATVRASASGAVAPAPERATERQVTPEGGCGGDVGGAPQATDPLAPLAGGREVVLALAGVGLDVAHVPRADGHPLEERDQGAVLPHVADVAG